jgi:hypothetical protein
MEFSQPAKNLRDAPMLKSSTAIQIGKSWW